MFVCMESARGPHTSPFKGIHPSAIVEPGAVIDPTAVIGPFCVIGAGVIVGPRTRIGSHCVIGGPPEHKDHWDSWNYGVKIGADCFISNAVTIDAGTMRDTLVEDKVTMLRHAHVGHDCQIGQSVTLSCNVLVGGHTIVMRGANCGLNATIHQLCVVGPLAMLGMGTIVTKKTKIEPFHIYVGNPARKMRRNEIGVQRSGLSAEQLDLLGNEYRRLVE
jgi:UDP-N-acetylglucosamine acyltransferase